MTGRIVVGISPRAGSPQALRWARAEAERRGADVLAVMVVRPPRAPGVPAGRPPAVPSTDAVDAPEQARQRLDHFLAEALGTDPAADPAAGSVRVTGVVAVGSAAPVLLRHSRDADLLVLDTSRPGRPGAVASWVLVPRVLNHARCPVVVMPTAPGVARRAASSLAAATARAAATAGRPGLGPRQGRPD